MHSDSDAEQVRDFTKAFENRTRRRVAYKSGPRATANPKDVEDYGRERRTYMRKKAPETWIPLLLSEAEAVGGKKRKQKLDLVGILRGYASTDTRVPEISGLEKSHFSRKKLLDFQEKFEKGLRLAAGTGSGVQPTTDFSEQRSGPVEEIGDGEPDPTVRTPSLFGQEDAEHNQVVIGRRSSRTRRKRIVDGFVYYSTKKTPTKGDPWKEM